MTFYRFKPGEHADGNIVARQAKLFARCLAQRAVGRVSANVYAVTFVKYALGCSTDGKQRVHILTILRKQCIGTVHGVFLKMRIQPICHPALAIMERQAVVGVEHAWHVCGARDKAADESAFGAMCVNNVKFLFSQKLF
ncbi:hypothetical protein SDC9_169844 [bioreactor metagenome]|uniref:Uncharacterized protein n=1 Tax=bioreactor metagenome TaxID=1076179 RepID=A0A645G6F0_9ZZZZ